MAELEDREIDALAGEYVLGQLAGAERAAAEARYRADPDFRRAVSEWERRLQPLADAAGAGQPSARTFDRILARIAATAAAAGAGGNVIALRRSVTRWRITSAIVGAAAAVLAGIVVLDRTAAPQSEFVAVLTAEGAKPAFVASIDTAKGTITVRRVVAEAPADKSYELWAIPPGGAPQSLGVVEQASYRKPIGLKPEGDYTFAISLEPKGGSKTGAPTGPVVFTGALLPTE
ncbi:MAG TPA: anti-sigma factor [Bauldia sp.]|nr:anti-sigma factor [Bauldia sp.]